MNTKTYYLARSYDEYRAFVFKNKLPITDHIYLSDAKQLFGLENPNVVRLSGYEFNKAIEDAILSRARKTSK